jgi:hypothetical protein
MPWYKQSGAFQHRAAVNHQLRWPFARGDGELPLLEAGKSAILDPKLPEPGECRIILGASRPAWHRQLVESRSTSAFFTH